LCLGYLAAKIEIAAITERDLRQRAAFLGQLAHLSRISRNGRVEQRLLDVHESLEVGLKLFEHNAPHSASCRRTTDRLSALHRRLGRRSSRNARRPADQSPRSAGRHREFGLGTARLYLLPLLRPPSWISFRKFPGTSC